MDEQRLRLAVIKLARENPALRRDLLPLLGTEKTATGKFLSGMGVALAMRAGKTKAPAMTLRALDQVLGEFVWLMLDNEAASSDPDFGTQYEMLVKRLAILLTKTRIRYDANADAAADSPVY